MTTIDEIERKSKEIYNLIGVGKRDSDLGKFLKKEAFNFSTTEEFSKRGKVSMQEVRQAQLLILTKIHYLSNLAIMRKEERLNKKVFLLTCIIALLAIFQVFCLVFN